ncbi:MAG TPA: efflux RND transporter periplasmic adaptor subunit [Burkholderiaceae bacterium]
MRNPSRLAIVAWLLASALPALAAPSPVADKEGRIRTQLSARNAVTLSAEIAGRIASMEVREGDAFRAGEPLVRLDCGLYDNQLKKAQAEAAAAHAVLQQDQRMVQLNAIGEYELQQAQAKVQAAEAEVGTARLLSGHCTVAAPFAGRVAKRRAASFEYVTPGTPLLDVVETGHLELQMIVPSAWLAWMKPGQAFSVEVDELGKRFGAHVQRIGAQIDPVSQTVAVFGLVDGAPGSLLPGMSGWASFPQQHH